MKKPERSFVVEIDQKALLGVSPESVLSIKLINTRTGQEPMTYSASIEKIHATMARWHAKEHPTGKHRDKGPTTVFNIGKYDRDLRKHEVYIGRRHPRFPEGSIWGNPFRIGKDGSREEVLVKYEAYLLASPRLLARVHTLKGKRLCCWCAPKPCHGDVLARLADAS
jgi:hypothetical protein